MSRLRHQRPRGQLILALLAVLALGVLLGDLTTPFGAGRAAAPTGGAAARPSAEQRSRFPDTPAGAAKAVAAYERSFATPAILGVRALQARIEAVATPAYARAMLAANSPGAHRLAGGPIGAGIRAGTETLYTAVPIGYKVESFRPARARVLTWGFTLLGNAATVEPAAYFGLTHTELRWTHGRWRIARTSGGFGPTPRLGTPPGPLGGFAVIDLTKELRSYALAP